MRRSTAAFAVTVARSVAVAALPARPFPPASSVPNRFEIRTVGTMLDVLQPIESGDGNGNKCDCHKCSSASCCRLALLQKAPQIKSPGNSCGGGGGALTVSEVAPELLVCGAAALRPGVLAALGVTLVINCTAELPDTPVPSGASLLRLPLLDVDSAADSLETSLAACCDAIEDAAQAGGRALVHCIAGISRSAALVLGYLVAVRRIPLATAFAVLRQIRPVARPRAAFFRVLIEWERRHLGCTSVTMIDIPGWACQIPDVYAKDYRNTLRFQARYGR